MRERNETTRTHARERVQTEKPHTRKPCANAQHVLTCITPTHVHTPLIPFPFLSLLKAKKKPKKKQAVKKKAEKLTKTGRKKRDKDPHAPKRARTAFNFFLDEFRHEYKERNPEAKGVVGVTKAGSEKWREMPDEAKQPYEQKVRERERGREGGATPRTHARTHARTHDTVACVTCKRPRERMRNPW